MQDKLELKACGHCGGSRPASEHRRCFGNKCRLCWNAYMRERNKDKRGGSPSAKEERLLAARHRHEVRRRVDALAKRGMTPDDLSGVELQRVLCVEPCLHCGKSFPSYMVRGSRCRGCFDEHERVQGKERRVASYKLNRPAVGGDPESVDGRASLRRRVYLAKRGMLPRDLETPAVREQISKGVMLCAHCGEGRPQSTFQGSRCRLCWNGYMRLRRQVAKATDPVEIETRRTERRRAFLGARGMLTD